MNDFLIEGEYMEDGYIHFPSGIDIKSRKCKISIATLRELEQEPEIELDFEEVFENHKNVILTIARKKINAGNKNPVIEISDIAK